ncbi:helix-turn-helix transcriptional regulator [Cytobacillus sp. Hz8]|uniref:helix-turn-helix transcriptional regulator n=1 Tax=Cytobacillus sp. Hz8 TaxID=3347168 RepID=UPI0035E34B0C
MKPVIFLRIQSPVTLEKQKTDCNVSRQTINAIENNKYDPSLTLAFQLAHSLSETVDPLFLFEVKGDVTN